MPVTQRHLAKTLQQTVPVSIKTNAHKIYARLSLLTSVLFQRKSNVRQKYRCRQRASIRCFFYTQSSYMFCRLLLKVRIR